MWPVSKNKIWAVGALFLQSQDGGRVWKQVDAAKGLLDSFPGRIGFLDDSVGWILGDTSYGLTMDGGTSWETHKTPSEAGEFSDMVYVNKSEAWAVSYDGLFRSNDGGQTWLRMREGKYGVLQYVGSASTLIVAGDDIFKLFKLRVEKAQSSAPKSTE